MPSLLDNPQTVIWSHSDSTADFFELPTEGAQMHEALGWLLQHYKSAKLWIGLESEDGVELFVTCTPSRKEEVVNLLQVFDEEFSIFEAEPAAAVGE
ncbi:MAG: hypothetical protein ACSHX8_02985 [Opitutaceae bacterium]